LKAKSIVDEARQFYRASERGAGTHIALRWKNRMRFILPRDAAGQKAYWKIFHPGWLELPLRAIAYMPPSFGSASCVETDNLASIRKAIGTEVGLSCCHAGAPGVWSKDTILLLDKKTVEPLYVVKAGFGEAVSALLCNEAKWLHNLRAQASLANHIPEVFAHSFGEGLSFVAESPLQGKVEYTFGDPHIRFLRIFQDFTRQTMWLDESALYQNLRSRLKDICGLLSEAWSTRLEIGMQQIEQSLSGTQTHFVAAHNDFSPWNLRVDLGVVRAFDWEYADDEQLPMFDPLHFILLPMALKGLPLANMLKSVTRTQQMCRMWLGNEYCCNYQTQVLAYLMNVCTLYLWSDRGASEAHPVLISYAKLIDHICIESVRALPGVIQP
jgi:hypothetical protein